MTIGEDESLDVESLGVSFLKLMLESMAYSKWAHNTMTSLGTNAIIYLQSPSDVVKLDESDWRVNLLMSANYALLGISHKFMPIVWSLAQDLKLSEEIQIQSLAELIGATPDDQPSFWLYHSASGQGIRYTEPINDPSSASFEVLAFWAV